MLSLMGCGRVGFDKTLTLTLEQPRIENALDSATFRGECSLGVDVEVDGVPLGSCSTGQFQFTTPSATEDGTRLYVFSQSSDGIRLEVKGTWIRDSQLPQLTLDSGFLGTGADSVRFSGGCTTGSPVEVDEGAGPTVASCTGGRFSFDTTNQTVDGTYSVRFSQTTSGGDVTIIGRWQRLVSPTRLSTVGVALANGFGDSIAVSGNTIFAGTPLDDVAGTDAGAVFLYPLTDDGYGDPQVLRAPTPEPGERFGESLFAVDDWLFIGADCLNQPSCTPTVYVYRHTSSILQLVQEIDGAAEGFGNRVVSDGNTLVIPSAFTESAGSVLEAGAVYVYPLIAGPQWGTPARLVGANPIRTGFFGERVGVDGEWLVAAHFARPEATFQRSSADWIDRTSDSPDLAAVTNRVSFLQLDGDAIFRGSSADSHVQYFVRSGTNWQLQQTITGAGLFGQSGHHDGGLWAVADPTAADDRGVVTFYALNAGTWTPADSMTGDPGQRLGFSQTLVVGNLVIVSNENLREVVIVRVP